MASRSTLLVFTLLSVACTMSSGAWISSWILGGVVTCTNTSLAVAGTFPVMANAKVDLVCGGGSLARVVHSVLTNTAGLYDFVITATDTALNDPGSCFINVTLPPNSCNFNLPTGTLRSPVVVLRTVDALVGQVLILVPGPLSYVHMPPKK